uniref:NADH dehydrogenase [ubiquinone] 1 alpha subcomplex subunit 7 n=1 Tax=Timema douglasi TaxID=61478 RepID=A0A7R8VXW7_TIMDO|nr:unnamed protein product [Timema douglasi]
MALTKATYMLFKGRLVRDKTMKVVRKSIRRSHKVIYLFADGIAARTQPPPVLPEGPAHKLAANYYYDRDGRREVKPATVLAGPNLAFTLGSGQQSGETAISSEKKPPTPGSIWHWD